MLEQLKKEDKIKKAAIKELVKNPTEEIKNAVIEQLPEEQKETIVAKLSLAPREKVMILQGGLLNAIKELGGDF